MSSAKIIVCPNCQEFVEISKINCGIFCHGVFRKSGKQLNPHISAKKAEEYAKKGLLFGCGKHFTIPKNDA